MALSIKTQEADALARRLVRLTGETMTEAVTVALRERLSARRRVARRPTICQSGSTAFAERVRGAYDTRPVTKAEWDAASGDEA